MKGEIMSTFSSCDKRKIKDMIKILKADGWYEVRQTGSHKQFKHPVKKGVVTVSMCGINRNLELSILRQAGLKQGYGK